MPNRPGSKCRAALSAPEPGRERRLDGLERPPAQLGHFGICEGVVHGAKAHPEREGALPFAEPWATVDVEELD